MAFESLTDRYKTLPIWKRIILLGFIGISPSILKIVEDGQALQDELNMARVSRDASERKFKKSRKRKANLPKLEEQLAHTEGQLALASKKLPDEFVIEKVLQKVSIIAQDVGLDLREFDPGDGAPTGGLFKYVELPIRLEVFGTYGQIATFFDRIVHLELLVHIKDIEMQASMEKNKKIKNNAPSETSSPEQLQKKARDNTKILATSKMVIFRTLNNAEESAIAAIVRNPKHMREKRK